MGQMFPTRLSFMRILLRKLGSSGARVERTHFDIDADGFGEAVYTVRMDEGDVSLFAMTRPLDESARSDRVIATAWDAAFVLYDGVPNADERQRLCDNAPLQEAGRFTERDLVLSRANKSVRMFNAVVEALRSGSQPEADDVIQTGYLMRTTAVYGNGKFGVSDHSKIRSRTILGGAFMAEMLAVWLIRGFTHDLVEHLGGKPLNARLKRHLGVGNATGLGMAPYLVSHPHLTNSWFETRERALAEVLSAEMTDAWADRLQELATRVSSYLHEWAVADEDAMADILALRSGWPSIVAMIQKPGIQAADLLGDAPNEGLQELVAAMLIESRPDLVDGLESMVSTAPSPKLDPTMDPDRIREALARDWSWATSTDYDQTENSARFWYVSEEKLEPRIGERYGEPGADRESPLDIARRVAAAARDLEAWSDTLPRFLMRFPEHRTAIERVQGLMAAPYGEIRDNLIAETCRPIDMLRSKLAMFGASKFDPKSELWTRISLAQGAPLLSDLGGERADDWWLSALAT